MATFRERRIDHYAPVDVSVVADNLSKRLGISPDQTSPVVGEVADGAVVTTYVDLLAENALRKKFHATLPPQPPETT